MSSLSDASNDPEASSEEMRPSSSTTKDNETVAKSDQGTVENEENIAPSPSSSSSNDSDKSSDESRKENVNLIFIGHVDAGKSTLGGQLLFQTGMVDKRTMEKYEREARENGREGWSFAFIMDTDEEERKKGKTNECGRAFFETEKRHYTIIDSPGHKIWLHHMINGASQADVGVLIISARQGEFEAGFEQGQTKLHSMIVKAMGVRHLVILINKMDDPTVKWDQEKWICIQGKLNQYLKSVGYNLKSDVTYIPVSGLSGAFIKERPRNGDGDWYKGPCFIDYLDDHIPFIQRDLQGPVRARIVEKLNSDMTCYVKIESGVLLRGQNLILMPDQRPVMVAQIWVDKVEKDRSVSGDIVKIKLRGVEEADIQEGFILAAPNALCKVGKAFQAEVVVLECKNLIAAGFSSTLYIQSVKQNVTIKNIRCTIDRKTGNKKKTIFVKEKDKCILQIESATTFCLEPFDDCPQLGRFILHNNQDDTVAIGKVLKVLE